MLSRSFVLQAAALSLSLFSAEAFSPSFTPALAKGGHAKLAASHGPYGKLSLATRAPRTVSRASVVNTKMEFLAPPAIYEAMSEAGKAKATMPVWKTFYLGILAGAYIGFGSCLALTVGGACQGVVAAGNLGLQKIILGSFGLPLGLLMVVCAGGELFTGNAAAMTTAVAEGKATTGQLIKNWIVSYVGNLVGAVSLAALVATSGALAAPSIATAKAITVAKTSLPFVEAFTRGILCNWLVCMGVWLSTAAKDIGSKAIAIWFPISAFVTMGFEHSVANMFFLPTGIFAGAGVTWKSFFLDNLLPVTLGNAFAGAVLVAGFYALTYGSPGRRLNDLV